MNLSKGEQKYRTKILIYDKINLLNYKLTTNT